MPHLPRTVRREVASFDVIHLHGSRSFMVLPVVSGTRKAGIPFVLQPHGTLPIAAGSFPGKRLYDRLLGGLELKRLSAVIAGQESERRQAMARGEPAERIEIIPNWLSLSAQAEIPEVGSFRRQFGLSHSKPLILFLGRINKNKGADMLVEAFHQLEGVDAHLAVVGPDDGQLAEVERLIREYRLGDNVTMPGLLSGAEVMAARRDADIFVLPCRADTFPMAILEACLMGTPMVVTDRCKIAHLVKDRVADVVPFDPGAFAEAMRRLLTDGERHQTYRENCPRVMAQAFSLQAVVDRLEGLYQTIIARQCRGAG